MFLKYIWEGLLGVVVVVVGGMFWFGDVNVIMLWLCWLLMFEEEDVFELENEFNHWLCK
jgi:hypothetical protein